MKLNSKISNTVILLLGIVATLVLTQLGCQNATKSGVKNHEIEETHARPSEGEKPPFVQDATIEEGADLDQVVENAVQNIAKGRETVQRGMQRRSNGLAKNLSPTGNKKQESTHVKRYSIKKIRW